MRAAAMTGVGRTLGVCLLLASMSALAAGAGRRRPAPPAPVRYNRDVRPVLAENCFACHGPDANKRQANLRLDRRQDAVDRGAIVPGRPAQSPLVARVFSPQPAVRMPPAAAHKQLTATQKLLLKRWIAEGARYEPHWAFVPLPARVPLPPVKNARWCRNGIDRFVLARLEAEGLRPSPAAARADWLRRVTLDLTGLPPTLAELDAFLADHSPGADEQVVDRLLASQHYGEQQALPWLDIARYADSYGYQSDLLCPTWPYRDWVVKAFNDNLRYDQFIAWQLAGDLLWREAGGAGNRGSAALAGRSGAAPDDHPPGSPAGAAAVPHPEVVLATAFNRLHRMTNEGGSVPEEWRLEGVADRVQTFGTAFMGLTLECARCHDHKYDPIAQREYYGLSAFFNSIDEYGLYDRADIVPTPTLLLPTPEQARELAAAGAGVAASERELAAVRAARETAFREWLAGPGARSPGPDERAGEPPRLADLTGWFDFEGFEGATLKNRVAGATRHGARADDVPLVEGHPGRAAQLDGENNVSFPELGRFTRHTPFTLGFWMRDALPAGAQRAEPAVVFQACSGTDTGPHGYDLLLEDGRLTARLFRHWPGNAIAVRTEARVPRDAWTHVAVTYDGSSRAAGMKIYLDGKVAAGVVLRDRLSKGTGQHPLVFGQRFRDRGFKGGRIDDLAIVERALTPLEVAGLADGRSLVDAAAPPSASESELREYYLSAVDAEARRSAAALAAARARLVAAEDAAFEIAVMDEQPEPRPTYVLPRGRYDAPRTEAARVGREVPGAILPFPPDLPRNRLGLARWLVRPEHPLTARVAVNRFWAICFGRGLVETVENFGIQGRPPSHPELLDWLAVTFRQGNWDPKALLRLMVLSSTYRQASAAPPSLRERDPENVLLARGPSRRLSAEAVRDLALAASGLLDGRVGGPPVSPYQPGDLWRESNTMSPAYRQSVGPDLYRRSLYTVWKRTAPMPNMLAFDAVSREVCVARRQSTSTPLQALVLLNDPQFVEAARVLGERALKEAPADAAGRVRLVFRLLASREPTPAEARLLVALYEGQRAAFAAEPEQAAKLLAIGARRPDPAIPAPELAAATALAQAVLNLDATIWER